MASHQVKITFPSGKTIDSPYGKTANDYMGEIGVDRNELFAVRLNNEVCSLNRTIVVDTKLEPVTKTSKDGVIVYRKTLCFVLAAAMHKVAPKNHLLIGHSVGYGYYYTLKNDAVVTDELISKVKDEMQRIIDANLPIDTYLISYEEAVKTFEDLGLDATRKQLDYICPGRITMNSIGDFSDLYFGPLLPSTGLLKVFDLVKFEKGFLLRFPAKSDPDKLTVYKDSPAMTKTHQIYKDWGKRMGVTTAADLNELVANRKLNEFITITEIFQERCIGEIANQIRERKDVRLILIAGPSSSGKTTSAKKLALELRAIGYNPKVISLDSYYVGRDRNPKDENGNYDYECLEALDIELINQNLVDLFDGKEIDLPDYDFAEGIRIYKGKKMKLDANDILIMEGIHGLNDKLTPLVKPEYKFKIFLSPMTQLSLNEHNHISTSDNRLIRRIVRDNNFRGKSAAATISMWPSVQRGERLHIFPHQGNADAVLNTALDYELSVLKVYATPLLRRINPTQVEYSEACRLLRFLDNFPSIPASDVPNRSIIREFIGGSAFKY